MSLATVYFGVTCVIGIGFLLMAATIRWRSVDAGWRAALFSAGFGMAALGGMAPLAGRASLLLMLVVAAAAQLFVGISALGRRSR